MTEEAKTNTVETLIRMRERSYATMQVSSRRSSMYTAAASRIDTIDQVLNVLKVNDPEFGTVYFEVTHRAVR